MPRPKKSASKSTGMTLQEAFSRVKSLRDEAAVLIWTRGCVESALESAEHDAESCERVIDLVEARLTSIDQEITSISGEASNYAGRSEEQYA